MNPLCARVFSTLSRREISMTETLNEEADLIRRWVLAFREMPVLVDVELMRAVLDDLMKGNKS